MVFNDCRCSSMVVVGRCWSLMVFDGLLWLSMVPLFPRRPWECVTSCEFLQSVLSVKQGACPLPDRAAGFEAACVDSCDRDRECPAHRKCCSNGCGHTCQTPKDLYRGCPLKPRKDLVFHESSSGSLDVRWSSRFNVSSEPVVYVLQRRWNYGVQPSEDSASPWEEVGQTSEPRSRLSDIRPGRWYQFRVAAVNTHGTKGFTTPSRHIHSAEVNPSSPPAPSDLRVVNMTFGPGRTVSTLVRWTVPQDLDVPVHHYKVSWSWTEAGVNVPVLTVTHLCFLQNQVVLDSLRSNRTYRVEVQAMSYWAQNHLKGPRALLHFSTQTSRTALAPPPFGDVLDVGTPFYQDDQLRVHVYWRKSPDPSVDLYRIQWEPEFCGQNRTRSMQKTTSRSGFHGNSRLKGLLFSCKYNVLLQPISSKTRPPAERTSFYTPSCSAIQAKSPEPISCGPRTVVPQKVPLKASNLTASFQLSGTNVTAIFSWEVTMATPTRQVTTAMPPRLVTGLQVTWAEVMPTGRYGTNKLQHSLVSQTRILPPNAAVLVVSGLHPAGLYRLEVQVLMGDGEGLTSSRTFQTPGYQSKPRLRNPHHKQPLIERH
uniref:Anosmin 1a n=1 Tax=Sphaeramia orbicularis TaxID=375764 RepID=A0A672YW11_9TELE